MVFVNISHFYFNCWPKPKDGRTGFKIGVKTTATCFHWGPLYSINNDWQTFMMRPIPRTACHHCLFRQPPSPDGTEVKVKKHYRGGKYVKVARLNSSDNQNHPWRTDSLLQLLWLVFVLSHAWIARVRHAIHLHKCGTTWARAAGRARERSVWCENEITHVYTCHASLRTHRLHVYTVNIRADLLKYAYKK